MLCGLLCGLLCGSSREGPCLGGGTAALCGDLALAVLVVVVVSLVPWGCVVGELHLVVYRRCHSVEG